MATKEGNLYLQLESGKDTAIGGRVYWYTQPESDNVYRMYIKIYAHIDMWLGHTRDVSYSFWVGESIKASSTATVNSDGNEYVIYETNFLVETDNEGYWTGIENYFGADVEYTSEGSGLQRVAADTEEGMLVGAANYKVIYYTGFGSNALFDSQSGFDKGNTCTLINNYPARDSISQDYQFTITGNRNTGDSDVSITATKTTITNYIFEGWSTVNGASSATYDIGSKITINNDVTLYGVWSESTSDSYENNTIADLGSTTKATTGAIFNITLVPNNGETSEIIQAGLMTTYTFKGWASTSSSSTLLSNTTSFTSSTTVYAVWESSVEDKSTVELPTPYRGVQDTDSYTVTLDPLSGTVSTRTLSVSKSKAYTFLGWSTVSDSSSDIVSNPYTPTNKSAHNLYAIWQETEGTGSVTLPIPSYPTFKFLGWAINANSTTYVPINYTPTQDITLYAVYKASYTGEPYIWHNGKWCKIIPHLNHNDAFNRSLDDI